MRLKCRTLNAEVIELRKDSAYMGQMLDDEAEKMENLD